MLATANERTSRESRGGAPSGADVTADGNEVVQAGDTVIVRFADNNPVRRRLTNGASDPGAGEVNVAQPVALALLGNGVEDEVELVVDGRARQVVIEKIAKAGQSVALLMWTASATRQDMAGLPGGLGDVSVQPTGPAI